MTNEIRVYYDREKKREVKSVIKFDPVLAGEITRKSLYFNNNIKYPIGLGIQLTGNNIDLKKTINSLKPDEIREIIFEFNPNITIMQPIRANLKITMDYIIKE